MRVKHAAARYNVTQHTVLAWIHSGALPAVDVSQRGNGKPSWWITPEGLEAFEAARASTPRRLSRHDAAITTAETNETQEEGAKA